MHPSYRPAHASHLPFVRSFHEGLRTIDLFLCDNHVALEIRYEETWTAAVAVFCCVAASGMVE